MSNVWSNFQFFSTSYCQKSLTVCVCIRRWKISLNSSLKLILPMKKLDFPIKKELPTDKNGRRSQHSKYWDGQSTRPHLISSSTFNWSPPPSNSPKARNGDRQVWKQAAGQDGDHWGGAVSRAVSAKPSARWDLSVFEPRSLGRSFWAAEITGVKQLSLKTDLNISDKLWSALIVRGRTSFSPVVRSWNRYHLNIVLLQDCTTK